jgi:hypothetical protein
MGNSSIREAGNIGPDSFKHPEEVEAGRAWFLGASASGWSLHHPCTHRKSRSLFPEYC